MIPAVEEFGIVGFVIAPPLTVALQVLLHRLFNYYMQPAKTALQIAAIEDRYFEVQQLYLNYKGEPYR